MATDKKISELQAASSISGTDISVLVSNGTDAQFTFATLLQYVSAGITTGAVITYGTAMPQSSDGKNGDLFINTAANAFAQKLGGTWTVIYTVPAGNTWADGTVLYGLSAPATSTGKNNDTYINTGTGIFYQKQNNAWSQVFSMQTGPAGAPGAAGTNGTNGADGKTVLNGTTAPANTTGSDGDFYIDTANWTIFGPKASGAWPAGTSIIGSPGDSAYQTWISLGNNGSQTDFVNSLKGMQGLAGNGNLNINEVVANYTLTLSDNGNLVLQSDGAISTITIPNNSAVAFPIGSQVLLNQYGAGQITVVADSGVTLVSTGAKVKTSQQYSTATLIQVSLNTWLLAGDIA